MSPRRLLVIGAAVVALIFSALPAAAKGRTLYIVSGGDLKHSVSIDDAETPLYGRTLFKSRAPALSGPRYDVKLYDPAYSRSHFFAEWTYVPDASGAIPIAPADFAGRPGLADDGGPLKWIAFDHAFNSAFLSAIHSSKGFPFAGVAVVALLLVAVALPAYVLRYPRRLLRRTAAAAS